MTQKEKPMSTNKEMKIPKPIRRYATEYCADEERYLFLYGQRKLRRQLENNRKMREWFKKNIKETFSKCRCDSCISNTICMIIIDQDPNGREE